MLDIGSTIKLCREARKLTLQELSDRTDLTKSYLSRIENNQKRPYYYSIRKNIISATYSTKYHYPSF